MTTFLANATTWTDADIAAVITEQLAVGYDTQAGNLRTAAMYCPVALAASDFARIAWTCGVNGESARKRYNETRAWQRELGEI